MKLHAVSEGSRLRTPDRCALFSLHDSAVNFAPPGNEPLVSVVSDESAMTVSSVLLSTTDFARFHGRISGSRPQDVSLMGAGAEELRISTRTAGETTITRRGAKRFDGEIAYTSSTSGTRSAVRLEIAAALTHAPAPEVARSLAQLLLNPVPPPTDPFLQRAADAMLPSFKTQDPTLIDPARLVGLGPGMTPSGDDFLVGLLAGLEMTGRRTTAKELGEQILRLLRRTTHPGGTILLHAVERCFPAYLVEVARAICEARVAEAVEAASRHGATSGLDALAGLAVALGGAENPASAQT